MSIGHSLHPKFSVSLSSKATLHSTFLQELLLKIHCFCLCMQFSFKLPATCIGTDNRGQLEKNCHSLPFCTFHCLIWHITTPSFLYSPIPLIPVPISIHLIKMKVDSLNNPLPGACWNGYNIGYHHQLPTMLYYWNTLDKLTLNIIPYTCNSLIPRLSPTPFSWPHTWPLNCLLLEMTCPWSQY